MYIHKYMHVYMYQHTRVCAPKKDSKHFDSCCTYRILLHGFQLQCQELWLEVLYLVLHFCIAEALAMAEAFAIFFRPVAVEHGGFVQNMELSDCSCYLPESVLQVFWVQVRNGPSVVRQYYPDKSGDLVRCNFGMTVLTLKSGSFGGRTTQETCVFYSVRKHRRHSESLIVRLDSNCR